MKHVEVNEVPEGAQLIDVREVDEFEAVHAKGAKNVPMSEFVARMNEVDDEQDVYIICKSGGRSQQVGQYLEARDIPCINVYGGTDAWVAAGLPTE